MSMLRRVLAVAVVSLAACGGDGEDGSGSLKIIASGEEAAIDGYPVGSGDGQIAFEDGWTLKFDKVIISLDAFKLETADGDSADLESGPVVADLHIGTPTLWNFKDVPAKRWDRVGYEYRPPTSKSRAVNAIDDADLERMIDKGYSFYLEAVAKKDDKAIAIQYGFAFSLDLSECENGRDGSDGIVVADNALNEAQVTVHLDHLFLDTFAVDDASLRFDAMAAVAPAGGPLTLADLAKQDNLSDLKDASGDPLDVAYDPGSNFNPVPKTLEEYVSDAASTTGHWNGEGHCHYKID